jgi:hypothetical protein
MAKTKHIKVRDLKPSKDAKGGGAVRSGASANAHGLSAHSLNSAGANAHGLNSAGTNTKTHQHGGGKGHG